MIFGYCLWFHSCLNFDLLDACHWVYDQLILFVFQIIIYLVNALAIFLGQVPSAFLDLVYFVYFLLHIFTTLRWFCPFVGFLHMTSLMRFHGDHTYFDLVWPRRDISRRRQCICLIGRPLTLFRLWLTCPFYLTLNILVLCCIRLCCTVSKHIIYLYKCIYLYMGVSVCL